MIKPIVCFVITKVELVVSFRVRHHSSPSNISMTAKKLPSLPSSVVSKTCSTLAQCLRQLFERSALSKRPYPTPVVLGDRQDSIGRETDPSQLSQPAGMPMPMPNRQTMPHASPIFLNRWLVGAHKRDRPRCGKKVPQMILQIFVTSNTTKRCHVHNLANMDSFPHMLQTKVFRSHLNIGDQVILLGLLTYNDDCLNISNDRK